MYLSFALWLIQTQLERDGQQDGYSVTLKCFHTDSMSKLQNSVPLWGSGKVQKWLG